MMKFSNYYIKLNVRFFFVLIMTLWIIVLLCLNNTIYSKDIFLNIFSDYYASDKIMDYLLIAKRNIYWVLTINLMIVFAHIVSMSILLYLISYMNNVRIRVVDCVNLSLKAEVIFIVQILSKIIELKCFFIPDNSLELAIIPFSILKIMNYSYFEPWLFFAINYFNIFELFYILFISYLYSRFIGIGIFKSFNMLSYGYLSMLILYILIVILLLI